MSLQERIIAYLRSIAPQRAANADIRHNLGVRSHQQVYVETQYLLRRNRISGQQNGHEWEFWVDIDSGAADPANLLEPADYLSEPEPSTVDSRRFEQLAQEAMSRHYGVLLTSGSVPSVPKRFDLVSADRQIIGDAKYFTLVGGTRLPPAKFSVIAEYVWLLEKANARCRFLVFGNDLRVPQMWLDKYGKLAVDIDFFFLDDFGNLRQLAM